MTDLSFVQGWSGLTLFTPAGSSAAALLLMRITALMWSAPLFSARPVSMQVKVAFTGVMVFFMWPAATAAAGVDVRFTPAAITGELVIGLTLGLGAGIFVAAAEAAGDMLAVQMGLSGANVLDPMSSTQLPVLGQFLGLFVLLLIVAAGGHLVILGTLHDSLTALPLGTPLRFQEGTFALVRLGSTLLWMGLRFAAPVVAAIMIGNAALGIMARTVPQLNILMVAFPVQISIGLFGLAVTLPLIATAFHRWPEQYVDITGGILERLAPGNGGL
ncbi:MAG: flagellar biosynthetic protein FliR [Gemmatimonadota bacterium]|nr:flagellar biosynthetic protein FliR [Gemmatimonadota bacterium]MDH5758226.1 flagellar biosynthetic protein FliR [Gemmatimonadota bacterium]